MYQVFDKYRSEFDQADIVAGEIVIDQNAFMKVMSMIMLPQGTTLKSLLGDERYAFVKQKAQEKSPMLTMLVDRMKPMITATILSLDEGNAMILSGEIDENYREPLDMYLQKEAKNANKEVLGLETLEEQLEAFDAISLEEQANYLYETLKNDAKSNSTQFQEMLEMYSEENLEALMAMVGESLSKETGETLVVTRNAVMTNRLVALMGTKSVFAAVGAAHLGGETGLIEDLRRRGYTVNPVKK